MWTQIEQSWREEGGCCSGGLGVLPDRCPAGQVSCPGLGFLLLLFLFRFVCLFVYLLFFLFCFLNELGPTERSFSPTLAPRPVFLFLFFVFFLLSFLASALLCADVH